jgi:hypothetical protein
VGDLCEKNPIFRLEYMGLEPGVERFLKDSEKAVDAFTLQRSTSLLEGLESGVFCGC